MDVNIDLEGIQTQSDDVVSRHIVDEVLIIPLTAGVGDADEDMYTLNKTAQAIWERLDGQHSLRDIVTELSADFKAEAGEIEQDVLGPP